MGEPGQHHKSLADRHLRELREESAIGDTVIAERAYHTITDPLELLALGFADYQCRTPALLIPLCGLDGANGRYALKPDQPRIRDGKPVKYEYPAGSAHMLDCSPCCTRDLQRPGVPLFFTEGAKKADCLASHGFCAVNIWGTSAWYTNPEHGGFATIQPLADWDLLTPTLDGRICYLAYDSDAWRNPNVARELRRLANWLSSYGALVFIVHLPDEPDGSKNGVDDYVARYGPEDFRELVAAAEPWGSQAMVRHLHAELAELRVLQSAQAGLLRNTELTSTQKIVAIGTINEAGWRASTDAPAPYRVRLGGLAAAAGCSANTVSQALGVLSAEGGLFSKQVTREFAEDTGWTSALYLRPRGDGDLLTLLRAAAVFAPVRPERESKPRPCCPLHPTSDVFQRSTSTCTACGQVLRERTQVLKHKKRDSETESSPVPSSVLNSHESRDSGPCERCGRPWSVHGAVDIFGICDERGPPVAETLALAVV